MWAGNFTFLCSRSTYRPLPILGNSQLQPLCPRVQPAPNHDFLNGRPTRQTALIHDDLRICSLKIDILKFNFDLIIMTSTSRSITVHGPNEAAARFACANITQLRPVVAMTTESWVGTDDEGASGTVTLQQASEFDTTKVREFRYLL